VAGASVGVAGASLGVDTAALAGAGLADSGAADAGAVADAGATDADAVTDAGGAVAGFGDGVAEVAQAARTSVATSASAALLEYLGTRLLLRSERTQSGPQARPDVGRTRTTPPEHTSDRVSSAGYATAVGAAMCFGGVLPQTLAMCPKRR
jgi:hypothetical protein